MNDELKEVYFNLYCNQCKYKETEETEKPCNDCMSIPARPYSHKPEYFKEKESKFNKEV